VALFVRECDAEKSNHRHRRLLRPRRERPSSRTAEQRDELASFHRQPPYSPASPAIT
jgi:hypothetical protein